MRLNHTNMEREEGRIAVVAHAGVNDVFINLAYGRSGIWF